MVRLERAMGSVKSRYERKAEMKEMTEVAPNIELVRNNFIDKYRWAVKRPADAKTIDEIFAEANSEPHTALTLEKAIRDKEKEIRQRMGEKKVIHEVTKRAQMKMKKDNIPSYVSDLNNQAKDYFSGPLTSVVNLRSVLEAHAETLTRKELNEIVRLHNEACYEEPYGAKMIHYCAELVMKGKAKEQFPVQIYALSIDWPSNLLCDRF